MHGSPTPVDWQPVLDTTVRKATVARVVSAARDLRVIVSALRGAEGGETRRLRPKRWGGPQRTEKKRWGRGPSAQTRERPHRANLGSGSPKVIEPKKRRQARTTLPHARSVPNPSRVPGPVAPDPRRCAWSRSADLHRPC